MQIYYKNLNKTPYFTNFYKSERLILQILKSQNALFYIFPQIKTPYFTYLLLIPTLFLLKEVVEKAVHYFAFALGKGAVF